MGKFIGQVGLQYLWGKIKYYFVTALGTSGNYLTWTKNGTTNNITIPYATKATQDASGNTITSTYAPKASPALTGTPTAPTADSGNNTTQIATTEFVNNSINEYLITLTDNGSTTAGTWLAKSDYITSLLDGYIFKYKIAVAGAATTTLNVTNKNGVALGAKTVYRTGTTKLTTHYGVGLYLLLVYNTLNDCFRLFGEYDANTTTTYGTIDYYFRPYAGETLYRYKLVMLGEDNRIYPIVTTNLTDNTIIAKTPTTVGLRPYKVWYYNGSATVNAGAVIGGLALLPVIYTSGTNYTFNESVPTYRMVYLRGTYNKEKDLFYLYNNGAATCTSYYTFVPTNTANINLSDYFVAGYYYFLVGGTYSSTNYLSIFNANPFYYFDGTNLIPVYTKITNDLRDELEDTEEIVATSLVDLNNRLDNVLLDLEDDEQAIAGALTDLNNKVEDIQSINEDLSDVAFSGDYEDLLGTPNIPSWALNNTKPSYTLDEVTDGSSRKLANYLPLTGGNMGLDATVRFNTYGSRFLTISGTYLLLDLSSAPGTYAGSFYEVKTKGAENLTYNTVGLGFYGSSGSGKGLAYLFVASPGKNHSNPDIKFNVDGTTEFISIVKAPTAAAGTNTTQVATTAFVKNAVDSKVHYVANLLAGTAANYITEPEVKTVKINGSTTNAASTNNCVLQYDTGSKCLKFIFN